MHQQQTINQEVYDATKISPAAIKKEKATASNPTAQKVGHYLIALLALSFIISSCQSYQHPDLEIRQLGFQLTPEQDAYLDTANAFAVLRTIRGTKHKLDSLLTWTDMLKDHDEERALIYANEAYRLGTEKGYRLSRAIAMYYRALLKGRGGILGEGVEDALADAKISQKLLHNREDNAWGVLINGVLGFCYRKTLRTDLMDSAANYELKALAILEKLSFSRKKKAELVAPIYADLGMIYTEVDDSLRAIAALKLGVQNAEESENQALISRLWRNMGTFFDKRDDLPQADSSFQVALIHGLLANDRDGLIAIYRKLGDLHNSLFYRTKRDSFFETSIDFLAECLALQSESQSLAENIYHTYEILGYNYHDKFSFRKNQNIFTNEGDSAIYYYGKTIEEARVEGALESLELPVKYILRICDERRKLTGIGCSEILGDLDYEYEFINRNYVALVGQLYDEQVSVNARLRKFERDEEAAISSFRTRRNWLISGTSLIIASLIFVVLLQQQQQKRLRARMATLRAQINPHFMSNSLNAIENLVNRNDNDAASKYLIHFSRLSRKILSGSVDSTTSLAEELKTLEHFLALEGLRFKDKLTYQITVEEDLDPKVVRIPSLILQPYVENAILHGIKPKSESSLLQIKAARKGKELVCIVEDDGVGRKKAQELKEKSMLLRHKSQGMKITEERLAKVGKVKGSKVEIVDLYDQGGVGIGTRVIIRLPYKEID